MSYTSKQATHTTITLPATRNAGMDDIPSARQIFINGILSGQPKAETEALIRKYHPETAACTKFGRHYGWYKSTLKKEGKLQVAEQIQRVSVEDLSVEQLEALLAAKRQLAAAAEVETEAQRIERLQLERLAEVERMLAEQD